MESGIVYDDFLPESITEELGLQHIHLWSIGRIVAWNKVAGIIKQYGFFETDNPDGTFKTTWCGQITEKL